MWTWHAMLSDYTNIMPITAWRATCFLEPQNGVSAFRIHIVIHLIFKPEKSHFSETITSGGIL
jgi:hypothetical protein